MLVFVALALIFGVVSGAELQNVLNDFDNLLKSRNTSSMEFDACLSRVPYHEANFFGHAALKAIERNVLPALILLLDQYILDPNMFIGRSLDTVGWKSSNTLAYRAAACNKIPVLRLLQEYGADFNLNEGAETPIFPAIKKGHVEAVELLLSFRANVAEENNIGLGMICAALPRIFSTYMPDVVKKNLRLMQIVHMLAENGADVNRIDRIAGFPLLRAGEMPVEYSKALIELGADVNRVNQRGEYPLLMAIIRNNLGR